MRPKRLRLDRFIAYQIEHLVCGVPGLVPRDQRNEAIFTSATEQAFNSTSDPFASVSTTKITLLTDRSDSATGLAFGSPRGGRLYVSDIGSGTHTIAV